MAVYWQNGITALDEVEKVGQKFLDFRGDLVADALSVAASLTPVGKTKRTVRGWGAQVGNLSYRGEWRAKGSGIVRTFLKTLTKPSDRIFFGNDWFVAGFFEHGTGPRQTGRKKSATVHSSRGSIRARHMLARGIESVKGRRA